MNHLLTVEVADFVEAVDAALADLPADVRAELLEDLPAHLADVVADGGTPRDRLGEPAAYAAELRAAAGLPAAIRTRRRLPPDIVQRVQRADRALGGFVGYAAFSDLLRALQPAWWVLRGYLITLVVTVDFHRYGFDAARPRIGDSVALGVLTAIAVCALSVIVGRRSRGRGPWVLAASAVLTYGLIAFSLGALPRVTGSTYVLPPNEGGPLSSVTNIYPVGPDGKVIDNVRLVDQDGGWIELDTTCPTDDEFDPSAEPVQQRYPVVCPARTDVFDPRAGLAPLPATSTPATAGVPSPAPTR